MSAASASKSVIRFLFTMLALLSAGLSHKLWPVSSRKSSVAEQWDKAMGALEKEPVKTLMHGLEERTIKSHFNLLLRTKRQSNAKA